MMESHDEHKNENANSKTGLRVLIGAMVALIAFIAVGLIMAWNWEPPLFPDVDSIQEMTLISVDGMYDRTWRRPESITSEKFHGFPVIGNVEIEDPQDRQAIMSAVGKGFSERGGVSSCYYPRHGLRIKTKTVVYEYNICFECSAYNVYVNSEHFHAGTTSKSPLEFLNTFFEMAGVTIAPQADEISRYDRHGDAEILPATDKE